MIYTDPTGKRVSRDQAMIGNVMRAGYRGIVEDGERVGMQPGEHLGFSVDMVDWARAGRPAAVYMTDAAKPPVSLDAARKQWAYDKANSYRGNRPGPVAAVPLAAPVAAPVIRSAPAVASPANDAAAKLRIEDARRAWLADKESRYLGEGER